MGQPSSEAKRRYAASPKGREQRRQYYLKNIDRMRTLERERFYRVTYGLSIAKYEEMLADQDGCCKICRTKRPGSRLNHFAVDHDHATGAVRGLLCLRCNIMLGWYEKHLAATLAYLQG